MNDLKMKSPLKNFMAWQIGGLALALTFSFATAKAIDAAGWTEAPKPTPCDNSPTIVPR